MSHNKKELERLMRLARSQGWAVNINKHIRWQAPDGKLYFSSQSPSDWRVLRNIRRDLQLRGLVIK